MKKREKAHRAAALLALEAAEAYAIVRNERCRESRRNEARVEFNAAVKKIAKIFMHAPVRAFDEKTGETT